MPAPPGNYGVKGIFSRASVWPIDGEQHTITAEYVGAALPFAPTAAQAEQGAAFQIIGDPVGWGMADVAVDSASSTAVFYHWYLENSYNNYHLNLTLPPGLEQVIAHYPTGGKAGGNYTTTDGNLIWSFCANGGIPFVYRADGQPFGQDRSTYMTNVFVPASYITGLANARTPNTTALFVAQQARPWLPKSKDSILVLNGYSADAEVLATVPPLDRPQGISVRNGWLYALHSERIVSRLRLDDGLPGQGGWQTCFAVDESVVPSPFAIDVGSDGAVYLSDPDVNLLAKLDGKSGELLLRFGATQAEPKPGTYDRHSLMAPSNFAVWTKAGRADHIIVVENRGPARISEWDSAGALVREWMSPQTQSNYGWDVDSERPEYAYNLANSNPFESAPEWHAFESNACRPFAFNEGPWQQTYEPKYLNRFKVDYATGAFVADATWPNISTAIGGLPFVCSNSMIGGLRIINHASGRKYLAFEWNFLLYRFETSADGTERLLASAGIITNETHPDPNRWQAYVFRDANGNGLVESEEYTPTVTPAGLPGPGHAWAGGCTGFFGDTISDDLSLVCVERNQSAKIWSLPAEGFDEHGNPKYSDNWVNVATDPFFAAAIEAKARNTTAPALEGGNELNDFAGFSNPWDLAIGEKEKGYLVNARSGADFNSNTPGQQKLSYYKPNEAGEMELQWRVGRATL